MEQDITSRDQQTLDSWKITLIRLVYAICGSMLSERFFSGLLTGTAPLDAFVQIMAELRGLPNRADEVSVRLRGLKTGPRTSPELDYQIAADALRIDLQEATSIARRRGSSMMHLQGQLHKAWEVFRHHGITSVVIRLLEPTGENLELLRSSMDFLSRYYQMLQQRQPVSMTLKEDRREFPIIYDEQDQPDPNLTLLAYLNDLSKDEVEELVRHAKEFAGRQEPETAEPESFLHPVEILTRTAAAQERLTIPPIRVNTIHWVAIKDEEVVVSKRQLDLAEAIRRVYQGDEERMRPVLCHTSEQGLDGQEAEQFGRGLLEISNFLAELVGLEEAGEVLAELEGRVISIIQTLPESTLARMTVDSGILKIERAGKQPAELQVLPEFLEVLESKIQPKTEKLDVYRKLKNLHDRTTAFTLAELKKLSADFHVPFDEVDMFLRSLRRCFDENGNFQRDLFVEHGVILVLYIDQVFPLLLHYLKTTENKHSRLSLLNCMPALFERVEHPRKVVKTLLKRFCTPPDRVDHFDRNLLMLAVQLLRHYRKEKDVAIEMTPEEVLLVQDGLVPHAVALARQILAESERDIRLKIYTVRNALVESLDTGEAKGAQGLTPRFLFSLLREFYILLALIGGPVATDMLRQAGFRSSDPESRLYNQRESQKFLPNSLGLLKIIVRGYVRAVNGTEEGREDLKALKAGIPALLSKARGERDQRVIQQVLGYVDTRFE
jgi:hypothetical protein